jgi:hypothetical protein
MWFISFTSFFCLSDLQALQEDLLLAEIDQSVFSALEWLAQI